MLGQTESILKIQTRTLKHRVCDEIHLHSAERKAR